MCDCACQTRTFICPTSDRQQQGKRLLLLPSMTLCGLSVAAATKFPPAAQILLRRFQSNLYYYYRAAVAVTVSARLDFIATARSGRRRRRKSASRRLHHSAGSFINLTLIMKRGKMHGAAEFCSSHDFMRAAPSLQFLGVTFHHPEEEEE